MNRSPFSRYLEIELLAPYLLNVQRELDARKIRR
jgi:hypothetical protein